MRCTFALVFIALVSGLFSSRARAQQTQNACVQQYFDAGEFHTLAFRNICGAPIYVVWISQSPGLKGSMDIGAGMHASTGKLAKDIQLFGGLAIFACFKGYVPVDAASQPVTRPTTVFRCKRY
jgi:uncharacterized membrane protein AbrB (regulator of aidB expression)